MVRWRSPREQSRPDEPGVRYTGWTAFLRFADRWSLAGAFSGLIALGLAVVWRGVPWLFVPLSTVGIGACCFVVAAMIGMSKLRGDAETEEALADVGGMKRAAWRADVAAVIAFVAFTLWAARDHVW